MTETHGRTPPSLKVTENLFISDLHLTPERPAIMALFIRFCDDIASHADNLYILGDFLEVWWGDDDPAEAYQPVFDALHKLADGKTHIFLMHGNRDFMIGQQLAKRCGFTLIDEPYPIELAGKPALLMHGDSLCTDDTEYQKFRAMVRDPQWQAQVLTRTLEERYALARSIREQSKSNTAMKAEDIMDVNQQATEQLFLEHRIELLIHGHTHRPAIHNMKINGQNAQRIVLADWYDKGNYLRINGQNIEMIDYR